eukprot:11871696-Ditylum_brightwellii.AAC.2
MSDNSCIVKKGDSATHSEQSVSLPDDQSQGLLGQINENETVASTITDQVTTTALQTSVTARVVDTDILPDPSGPPPATRGLVSDSVATNASGFSCALSGEGGYDTDGDIELYFDAVQEEDQECGDPLEEGTLPSREQVENASDEAVVSDGTNMTATDATHMLGEGSNFLLTTEAEINSL